ncbi:MAG: exosortase E/protease, VPEID-CTERM system [Deltaproteobacteria bacterium]|nr:MAG: exosortase E/protease, VPEID-CTERM system [Deltaproteobacteria bacterium]
MGLLGPAVIAFGTALWILGGTKLRAAFTRSVSATLDAPPLLPPLAVHLVCFAGFFAITAAVFGGETPPGGPPELWIFLWLLGGAGTLLSLVPVAAGGLRLRPLLRELAIPLGLASLLALVAWGAGLTTLGLWEHLGRATLAAVAAMLGVLVSPIYFDPAEAAVGTEEFWVQVTPVCSGYEGIGLIIVFLSAYLVGFRERFRFPHAFLLLPVAILAVWLLNVVRIVVLILVGHAGYPDIAIGGFHSKAGWLFFCAVALAAVWSSQRVRWFAADPNAPRGNVVNPSAPFLLPLLAVVATALATGLFIDEFDYFYPLRVVVGLLVLAWYRQTYVAGLRHQLRGRSIVSWHAVGIGIAVYVLWIGISALAGPYTPESPPEALFELTTPLVAVWIMGRTLGAILVVPIVEELAFRGFLLRRLIASDFTNVPYDKWHWPAVLISSLAFAAVHQQWIGGFAAGVLYAYAQKRRGLLSDAIVAHAVTNALIALQVLAAGHWSLW